ncbi:hypothetical protein ATKI12_6757 [Kitasatospora sp. Ki12]|uniref:hypothetical protein n=1 Tax=Kitasatospora xanthocidica TaxID=83382 RepID=UPI001674B5F9|nr:hypothetical protein [Kitasatospora xanthocidica]GHF63977.1 hypothetical protein GCM10018790_47390 [Kitasatospora xanthocidica]
MPELVEWRPVAVVPLWRRGEAREYPDVERPGVLRGHPGPVPVDQEGTVGAVAAD